jgi:hypothetical protein
MKTIRRIFIQPDGLLALTIDLDGQLEFNKITYPDDRLEEMTKHMDKGLFVMEKKDKPIELNKVDVLVNKIKEGIFDVVEGELREAIDYELGQYKTAIEGTTVMTLAFDKLNNLDNDPRTQFCLHFHTPEILYDEEYDTWVVEKNEDTGIHISEHFNETIEKCLVDNPDKTPREALISLDHSFFTILSVLLEKYDLEWEDIDVNKEDKTDE